MDCNCQSFLAVTTRYACRFSLPVVCPGTRQYPLSILRVYRNNVLTSTTKKRAPEIVAPSNSHTGVVAAAKKPDQRRKRADQAASI
jgi:hypothetical protein